MCFQKEQASMAKPHTIAVAGKGGVGKTTTCGMIIDYLCGKKQGPVLVVDADANGKSYLCLHVIFLVKPYQFFCFRRGFF